MSKFWILCVLLSIPVPMHAAKDVPLQTLDWPDSTSPVLRFTFSKFKLLMNGAGKEHTYLTDSTVENLSAKNLESVNLSLYVFDKSHARIGDGLINLSNVAPGETVKFEITLYATGEPASVSVIATPPRTLSITINSVPQGADVKLDGRDVGTTPKLVDVTVGKHMLEFSKEGYNTGHYPLEMGPRDASGGSVSYELGVSAQDTIELRDGSVLSGDLISISGMEVQIRIGGSIKTYDRNQIKRVSLAQRDPVAN